MREARDSFLTFLGSNLDSMTVRNLRRDPNNPSLNRLMTGALNVKFGDQTPKVKISTLNCYLDIAHESELLAMDMLHKLMNLLQTSGYTPLLDCTIPTAPVPLYGYVYWDVNKIKFTELSDELCFRYSGSVTLYYHRKNEVLGI